MKSGGHIVRWRLTPASAQDTVEDLPLPDEVRRLCIALCGPRDASLVAGAPPASDSDAGHFDFFDLKGIIETLLERLGFGQDDVAYIAHPESGAEGGQVEVSFGPRCALVSLQGERLGVVGELHPSVRNAFGFGSERVVLAELDLASARPTQLAHLADGAD